MDDILNFLNLLFCIIFFPYIVIQLYITSDKIKNKYLRIAANVFPVFVAMGFCLYMRYDK